jgi:hypothetical protein
MACGSTPSDATHAHTFAQVLGKTCDQTGASFLRAIGCHSSGRGGARNLPYPCHMRNRKDQFIFVKTVALTLTEQNNMKEKIEIPMVKQEVINSVLTINKLTKSKKIRKLCGVIIDNLPYQTKYI